MKENGKTTLAMLKQEVTDYKENTNARVNEMKQDLKEIKFALEEIKDLFIKGDGKIKRNYMMIADHCKQHDKADTKTIAIATIAASLVTALLSFGVQLLN